MSGPGGREVGRISIRALPDTSSFARSLERYLERTEKRLRLDIPVSLDQGDVARTEAELAALTKDRKVEIDVDLDRSVVDRLSKALGGITGGLGGGGGAGAFGGLTSTLTRSLPLIIAGAAAVPVIVTGLLALPAIIASFATPFIAVALGIDGIKKAASGLREPFEKLRDSVSDTFQRGLTPVFDHLADIFPTLTTGFNKVADAVILMLDSGISRLVSDEGLASLGRIFGNLADALTTLAPSIGPFTGALLTLLEEGTAAFARMAPYLADFITAISKMVKLLGDGGALGAAFDAFSVILLGLVAAFGMVVGNAVILVGGLGVAARGVGKAVELIRSTVDKVMGKVAPIFRRVGGLIKAITRGDWAKVYDIIRNIAGDVVRFVTTVPGKIGHALGALAGILAGRATNGMGRFRDRIIAGAANTIEFVSTVPGRISAGLRGLAGLLGEAARSAIGRFRDALVGGAGRAVSFMSGLPGRILGAVGNLGGLLFSAGRSVIQGFIDGIQSMIGSIASILGSVTSRLPDWKGPAGTDRTILRESGRLVMGGFADGLEDGARLVESLLRRYTVALPSAVPATGLGAAGGPSAAGMATGALLAEVRALRGDIHHQTECVDQIVGDLPRKSRDQRRNGRGRS